MATGKQAAATKTAAPKRTGVPKGSAPPRVTKAVKSGQRSPSARTRAKSSSPTSASPKPSKTSTTFLWTRIGGLLLLILAGYALVTSVESDSIGFLASISRSLGMAAPPILLLIGVLGALLLMSPDRLRQPVVMRFLLGAGVVLAASVALLGAVGAGGMLGAQLWGSTSNVIGFVALPIFVSALILGIVLAGLPAHVLWSGLKRTLRIGLRGLSALLFGLVGVLVWVVRGRTEPEPASPPQTRQKADKPKPAEQFRPEAPTEAPLLEATQPMLPVIRKVMDIPSERPRPVREEDWILPPITLLEGSPHVEVSEADALQRAKTIETTLKSFGVEAQVREINPGPRVTQFALEPGVGTKVSRITSLQNDLALALAAPSIRMEAPVPGQSRVGLEIPNGQAAVVRLRDVFDSGAFQDSNGKLKMALGRDVTGRSIVGDLTRMPHLLIAGATGAGKSACLNSIISGFLFQHTPDELRFLMVDPKMVELKTYDGVPHLVWPVVTEMEKVVGVLKYAVGEMERRYKEFSELGIRNLDGYNRRREANGEPKLQRMIVIIDELADLMMAAPEDVEASICRLAQMARAVGIHLILATQRPSVDVLTGLIKANFPSRIAFAVSSQIDSRVILDMPGAERLLGRGDMLFLGPDSSKPVRVQGAFVGDEEIDAVVAHWKKLQPADYDPEVGRMLEAESRKSENPNEDPLYAQALELTQSHSRISTSLLQRKLRIGYNRAARLMDALKDSGDLDVELDD